MRNELDMLVDLRVELERLKLERDGLKEIALQSLVLAGNICEKYTELSSDMELPFSVKINAKIVASTYVSELKVLADRYSREVM